MLFLAAAAIAAAHGIEPSFRFETGRGIATRQPGTRHGGFVPEGGIAEATATVRIISGARITPGSPPPKALVRQVQLVGSDGRSNFARLIEFQ